MKLYEVAKTTSFSLPTVRNHIQGGRKERLDKALEDLAKYTKEGELIKTEFNDMKGTINTYLSDAYSNYIREKYFHSGRFRDLPEELRYDADLSVALHKIPGQLKKIASLKKKVKHPLLDDTQKFLEEIEPVAAAAMALKDKIVAKKRAKVEAEQAKEATEKTILSHKDVKKVQKMLTQITVDVRKDVEKGYANYYESVLERWKKQYVPGDRKTSPYVHFARDPYSREIVGLVVEEGRRYEYTVKKDWKTILKKRAARGADEMLQHFISKNTEKLGRIVAGKDNLKSITLERARTGSGVVEGEMKLVFKDGSSFIVVNKVVWKISKNGKPFYQYPTTFHNVKMPDGNKFGRPSEARMGKEFLGL